MSSVKIYKDKNYDFSECDLAFNENSYIVSVGNKIIGYFRLTTYDNETVLLDYELVKKYQNRGIGNYFYRLIERYIIDNYDFEKVCLIIRYDSSASLKIAKKHSYLIDNVINEENEMHNYSVYVKSIKR